MKPVMLLMASLAIEVVKELGSIADELDIVIVRDEDFPEALKVLEQMKKDREIVDSK